MARASASRDAWHPQTKEDRDAVLRELKKVLGSPQFSSSKRYPALLQYVVENTLEGRSELLKERTLGVEVFDRPPTYDTNTDTVVRYTAGEVRKRLLLYYLEHGRSSAIRISLPAGSYIPEFLLGQEEAEENLVPQSTFLMEARPVGEAAGETSKQTSVPSSAVPIRMSEPAAMAEILPMAPMARRRARFAGLMWLGMIAMVALGFAAGMEWRSRSARPQGALEDFWGPALHEQRTVLICSGTVVFAPNRVSGTLTAGKDIEYPFVSMEGASAISLVSGLLQSSGASAQLQSAGATPLSALREHSFILLGGFNNQWTLRLLEPLRFHFLGVPVESIVDQMQPQIRWARDPALPYSSADDFALVARYRDKTTGSWVVALAGVGRNGTEAAAQFATSPHYMQMLREQVGGDFANRNIEAVLKVSVIEGKTGAPSILAVHSW